MMMMLTSERTDANIMLGGKAFGMAATSASLLRPVWYGDGCRNSELMQWSRLHPFDVIYRIRTRGPEALSDRFAIPDSGRKFLLS